jgi:hypothetical protein
MVNAPSSFPTRPVPVRKNPLLAAERFTGRFLSTFAEFEFWMVGRLNRAQPGLKTGHLISQRLEVLRTALKEHPEIVRAPDEVGKLLDRLQPYVQIRTLLAHSRLTVLSGGEKSIYLFETPTPLADDPGKVRMVLRSEEFEMLRKGLSDLIEGLKQQTPEGKPNPLGEAQPQW